jgi:hypothetical protein
MPDDELSALLKKHKRFDRFIDTTWWLFQFVTYAVISAAFFIVLALIWRGPGFFVSGWPQWSITDWVLKDH